MTLHRLIDQYLRDDAGTPLGVGMPSGRTLRADGQSHYEAWQTLLRRDPCAYCGAPGASGTVDHIEPRSRSARGVGSTAHAWLNLAGACAGCNGSKRDLDLLVFLVRRTPRRGGGGRHGRSRRRAPVRPRAAPAGAASPSRS